MEQIIREIRIDAPRERVFDLARHVEAHVETMPEEDASGATGLLERGNQVTFRQQQFGLPFELTAEVVEMNPPEGFVDEQRAGVFGTLRHEHTFESQGETTVMRDAITFEMPLGGLGRLCAPVARRRLQFLVEYHAEALQSLAESEAWRRFLDE